jgi:hypothetical protein
VAQDFWCAVSLNTIRFYLICINERIEGTRRHAAGVMNGKHGKRIEFL